MNPPSLPAGPPPLTHSNPARKKGGCLRRLLWLIGIAVGLFILLLVIAGIHESTLTPQEKADRDRQRAEQLQADMVRKAEEASAKATRDENERARRAVENAARTEEEKATAAEKAEAKKAEAAEREKRITEIKWTDLDKIYSLTSKTTDMAKDEHWKRYKGREIRWTGQVAEVSDGTFTGLTLQVKMKPETFVSDVLIRLRDDQKPKAALLSKGDKVTFKATLSDWGSLMPISATDGVIIRP